MKLLGVHMQ